MGRRNSVFNKRANEQIQSARTSGNTGGGIIPQAHAQVQNPTINQSPQARTQSTQFDPWARANQFVQNVGRGGYDVGRSYTTDIADTVHAAATGREQEQARNTATLYPRASNPKPRFLIANSQSPISSHEGRRKMA